VSALARLAGIAAAAAVLAFGVTAPSSALSLPDLGCPPGVAESKVPPTPQMPTRGISGLLPSPDSTTTADPFAEGSDTSIYEAFGLAGLSWTAYDAGCGGPWVANPAAAMDTSLGNNILRGPLLVTATAGALAGIVYEPTWLGVFDKPLTDLSAGLRDAFWTPLAPFALGIAGVLIMWTARRSAFGAAATSALLVVAAIATVAVATAIPARLGGAADTGITSTTGHINARLSGRDVAANDPAVEAIAPFVDEVLYPRWLTGTLGDTESRTATTYGPDLFRASAFTWAEAAEADRDPARMTELVEAKQQLWTDTAEAISEADPDAYQHLTGFKENRFNEAFAAGLASGVLLFPIAAFLLMIASYVLIRFTVMTAPVWATFALLPSGHGILPGAATLLLAAVVNPVLAAVGATLTLRTTALLIGPDAPVPLWLGVLLSMLVCLIARIALKPFRRVWALYTGNPLRDAGQEMKDDTRKLRGRVGKVAGFVVPQKYASEVLSDDIADELEERGQERARTSSEKFVRADEHINMDLPDPVRTQPVVTTPPVRHKGAPIEADVDDAGIPITKPAPCEQTPAAAPDPADKLHVLEFASRPSGSAQLSGAHAVDLAGMDSGPQRLSREKPLSPMGQDKYVVYDYETNGLRVESSYVAPGQGRGESGA